MQYTGSCHCGKIAFEAEGEIEKLIECNCTHCQRKGLLLWFVPSASFKLKTPESDFETYHFNKHVIDHNFCPDCGVEPFARGKDPKGNVMMSVNARCLEDVELNSFKRVPYDGLHKN